MTTNAIGNITSLSKNRNIRKELSQAAHEQHHDQVGPAAADVPGPGEPGTNWQSNGAGVLLLRMFFALFCTIWRVRLK